MNRNGIALLWIFAALLAFLFNGVFVHRTGEPARRVVAKSQIDQLMTALRIYRLDVGAFPTEEQGLQALRTNPGIYRWNGPYLQKDVPVDPWGHPYEYSLVNGRPRIVSQGVGSSDGVMSSDHVLVGH